MSNPTLAALMAAAISHCTPLPWKWHWRFEDGLATGSIFSEERDGHAYAVAMTPRYQTEGRWKADATLIVTAVNERNADKARIVELKEDMDTYCKLFNSAVEDTVLLKSQIATQLARIVELEKVLREIDSDRLTLELDQGDNEIGDQARSYLGEIGELVRAALNATSHRHEGW